LFQILILQAFQPVFHPISQIPSCSLSLPKFQVKLSKILIKIPAVLLLEDGTCYRGTSIGKIGTTTGEICFNTGMTGYQEVFTDPSYFGQILVETNVHVGNYGIHSTEKESEHIKIAGLVCKEFNLPYSRRMASEGIQEYFLEEKIVGISDVDTREIVRHVRQKGAMNAIISSEVTDVEELKKMLAAVPHMEGLELSSRVSTVERYFLGNESAPKRVAVLDYGVKRNIVQCLAERDVYVSVFPGRTTFEEIKAWNPDGVLLSNGPGDPATMDYAVEAARNILNANMPVFGICLGHQILAQAAGLQTFKMHNGHRGCNHPVKNLESGKCEITSQNHGFAVDPESVKNNKDVQVTHVNLNDDTVEGIRIKGRKAFSVQYHPEASPGPHDSRYLFDEMVKLMS
jgi:carbamoyl-phosphate synthase small subunit